MLTGRRIGCVYGVKYEGHIALAAKMAWAGVGNGEIAALDAVRLLDDLPQISSYRPLRFVD